MGIPCLLVALIGALLGQPASEPPPAHAVVLVMLDGLRWQEVFGGADERLLTPRFAVDQNDRARLLERFGGPTAEARRAALMPRLWSRIARDGQAFGDRLGPEPAPARVRNAFNVSYPGYSEVFCGFADDRIKDNRKVMNPNVTVFEWLNGHRPFAGRVAAFGGWEVFPFIFNAERCGFPVDDGCSPVTFGVVNDRIDTVNRLRADTPYRWGPGAPFDALVYHAAREWIRLNRPRVVFLGLGETDEWAHEGRYGDYLRAAHRADALIADLWDAMQAIDEYRGRTAFILTCDHGRGGGDAAGAAPEQWRDHNNKTPGAEQTWIAAFGSGVRPAGVRSGLAEVGQDQIAATLAALLGRDYNAAQPKAGPPLPGVVGGGPARRPED